MGPLLFCIYTCNLNKCLRNCNSYFYADDSQIKYSFYPSEYANANNLINDDLTRLVSASMQHQLTLNPEKSSVLIFGKHSSQIRNNMSLAIAGVQLKCSTVARNLGVLMDNTLKFSSHITNCIKKSYGNLKLLYPHRHTLNESLKIKLTDTLVLSHFNYCDVLYGPCLDKMDKNRIERVQKSCLRYIYGIRKFEPISYKLKDAKWLNMENRRKYHAASLYHAIILNKTPLYLHKKIKYRTDVHTLNLRFRGLISPPLHHTAIFRRSFTYNIYILYNSLPLSFKQLNLNPFKREYKKHLLTNL